MLGQPDPLQPDDQDEHQPAARDGGQERRQRPERERADPEQRQAEHRIRDALLDGDERGQADHRAGEQREHARAAPAGARAAVGPDPVRDRDHQADEAAREQDVAPPVDRPAARLRALLELEVRPHRPEQADRDRDQEHEPPVDRREQAAEQQPDEHPADADDVVDPERHPALVGREGVGDDRRRVREQAGAADALHDPEHDQVVRAGAAGHPVDREQQRRDRVDDEAEVVDPHPAEHVAEAAEADDQHARDDEVAEDHPQQVEAVGRQQRVEVDAAEDVRHRDQRDRRVERGEQDRERRVREDQPLVAVVGDAARHIIELYRQTVQFACR